jgi:azurin
MAFPDIKNVKVGLSGDGQLGYKAITVKQNDKNSRKIEVEFVDEDGNILEIPSGYVAKFQATNERREPILNDCEISTNKIIYTVTEDLTAVAGTVVAEIGLYKPDPEGDTTKDELIQSTSFKVLVEKSAIDRNAVVGSSKFDTLTIMINTITGLITLINQKLTDMETATTNAINATNEMIQLNQDVTSAEASREQAETARVEKDARIPDWLTMTQAEYDALTQTEKDDLLYFHLISDSESNDDLADELTTLINDTNTAKEAAQQVVISQNNINDNDVNTVQTWSSNNIAQRMRIFTYTTTATTSSITHNLNFNPTRDDLMIIYKGVVLEETDNYTHSADYKSINLTGWTIPSGEKVHFRLYKFVK